ncbi:MAG: PEP-CTERM sorting domain-containing protein [Pseudomonadota bacterium]
MARSWQFILLLATLAAMPTVASATVITMGQTAIFNFDFSSNNPPPYAFMVIETDFTPIAPQATPPSASGYWQVFDGLNGSGTSADLTPFAVSVPILELQASQDPILMDGIFSVVFSVTQGIADVNAGALGIPLYPNGPTSGFEGSTMPPLASVPEPATPLLLGLGVLALGLSRSRHKERA